MKTFYCFWLIAITLHFIYCKSNDYIAQIPKAPVSVAYNCPKLIPFIQSDWRKHKKNGLYYYNNKFFTRLKIEFNTCVQQLTKSEVIKLFGNPSEDLNDGYLNYYLNIKCIDNSLGVCHYLTFVYDTESMKVIDFTEWKRNTME
jgi:hypothetical protein